MNISDQILEFVKCKRDASYFIDNYCYIEHPINGKVPFKLYDFQYDILKKFRDNRFIISNKSRQTGMSTITASYALWMTMFYKNRNIVILSITDQDAQSFLKKIKIAYHSLPKWMVDEPEVDNAHELRLKNGSSIRSVASGDQAARGQALSLLIIDEAAFIQKLDTIWTAAYPTLSRGGSAIMISTPNGIGNTFYELWRGCQPETPQEERNLFIPIFVHWTQIPEYRGFDDVTGMSFKQIYEKAKTSEWYKEQRPQVNDKKWAQEFEGDFLGSGATVVNPKRLKEAQISKVKPPIKKLTLEFEDDQEGALWIWEEPIPGRYYIIGADIASGEGTDYSTAQVLDVVENRQVAEYKGKVDLVTFSKWLPKLANYYNQAYLVPENTGLGMGLVQSIVHESCYPNIHQLRDEETQKQKRLKWGWSTTMKTRPLLISAVQKYFDDGGFEWYSSRLLSELFAFVWKSNIRAEADGSNNDDLVMAFAIATYCRDHALTKIPIEIKSGFNWGNLPKMVREASNLTRDGMVIDPHSLEPVQPLGLASFNEPSKESEENELAKWLIS